MTENLRSSVQGIWSHKLRSFLTMLGVIIGIAAIIAIVSTIKGTNQQIMENLLGAGNNCVNITLQQGSDEYWMDMGLPAGVNPVTEDQKTRIRESEQVQDASFFYKRSYADGISAGGTQLQGGTVMGIDAHYLSTVGYTVYKGRPFIEEDFTDIHKVVLLDEDAANALFSGENAVNQTIEIKGEPFTVAGTVKKSSSSQPVINSLSDYVNYTEESYGTVFMPASCWPVVYQFDEPEQCVVRAVKAEAMSDVGKAAENIMNESVTDTSDSMNYKAEDLLEQVRNRQELSAGTNNLLIWIASIALLVGGIGVMNIMLVSVSERTSEIGLKKALGARKRVILAQFLTESAMLTSIGGVLGVLAGIILAEVISRMSGAPVAISVPAILLSVAFSMLIGIVFGILPSVKAANLNPIDALRRE